jgi:hypothetical protein
MDKIQFNTDGSGLWSNVAKSVTITDMVVDISDFDFGELRVYFDTTGWDVNVDGLIYTDKQFLDEMREFLNIHGLNGADVDYSEQGMQDFNFVSCDIGSEFIKSWCTKFNKKIVKSLMTNEPVMIDVDTPWCCNPQSETYWSM